MWHFQDWFKCHNYSIRKKQWTRSNKIRWMVHTVTQKLPSKHNQACCTLANTKNTSTFKNQPQPVYHKVLATDMYLISLNPGQS